MSRVVFFTRATKESGNGHFSRVLRMIKSLSLNFNCELVVDAGVASECEGLKWYPIHEANPEIIIELLGLGSDDLIWFDIPDSHYYMLERFEGRGVPLVSTNMFEKAKDRRYEDIAIYPVFENYRKTRISNKTIQLSGVDFISLPQDFFYNSSNDTKYHNILVSMGGTDPMNFTPLVLEAISQVKSSLHTFKIVLPKGVTVNQVKESISIQSHIELYEFASFDFIEELKSAQYAIINGGMTRYECIAAHTYFIALSIHDAQAELSEKVTKFGYGKNFGVFNVNEVSRLANLLGSLPLISDFPKSDNSVPQLRPNGARWIYKKVLREIKHENE